MNSTVAIGGKLLEGEDIGSRLGSYLIPLINKILVGQTYPKPSHAPLAVILCPDWNIAETVAYQCYDLAKNMRVKNDSQLFLVGCVYANEKVHASKLTNGCHILVTTPKSLTRMLNPQSNITNLNRCCHIVFEEANDCFEKFPQEISEIVKKFIRLRKAAPSQPAQMIVSSSEWNEPIRQFVSTYMIRDDIVGPFLVISNPLEALIYSKLKFKAEFFESQQDKYDALCKLFEKKHSGRNVVFCRDMASSTKISKCLTECGYNVLEIHENLDYFQTKHIIEQWFLSQSILVISDNSTIDPLMLDQDKIIHFDYPIKRKVTFANRFLHMKQSVRSIYDTNECIEKESSCHLLFDPNDKEVCRTMVLLLIKCGSEVPSGLYDLLRTRTANDALNRIETPLCDNIKLFGKCDPLKYRCKKRHFISPKGTCGFNTESSLEPDIGPKSKIQLQNISCLNFNVMVP